MDSESTSFDDSARRIGFSCMKSKVNLKKVKSIDARDIARVRRKSGFIYLFHLLFGHMRK